MALNNSSNFSAQSSATRSRLKIREILWASRSTRQVGLRRIYRVSERVHLHSMDILVQTRWLVCPTAWKVSLSLVGIVRVAVKKWVRAIISSRTLQWARLRLQFQSQKSMRATNRGNFSKTSSQPSKTAQTSQLALQCWQGLSHLHQIDPILTKTISTKISRYPSPKSQAISRSLQPSKTPSSLLWPCFSHTIWTKVGSFRSNQSHSQEDSLWIHLWALGLSSNRHPCVKTNRQTRKCQACRVVKKSLAMRKWWAHRVKKLAIRRWLVAHRVSQILRRSRRCCWKSEQSEGTGNLRWLSKKRQEKYSNPSLEETESLGEAWKTCQMWHRTLSMHRSKRQKMSQQSLVKQLSSNTWSLRSQVVSISQKTPPS